MQTSWHTLSLEAIERELSTSFHSGLSKAEAKTRLESYGLNQLPVGKSDNLFVIFLRQFKSPLIYILLAAAVVVFAMGEAVDSAIILLVLVFNAAVGTIQEGKAQNALSALKRFSETQAVVLRDSEEIIVPDKEIVPGDILILQEGEKVPADARVIESRTLRADESAFTGESVPVHKIETTLHQSSAALAEQINMVFKGTNIASGSGRAVVVATGLNSEIGKISRSVALIDTEIPLQKDIRSLSRFIIFIVAAISVGLFLLGIFFDKSAREMFGTVVSLAVSIIPEGLPIVLTFILAAGVWRMAKHNVLVKKLQAVEALGQAQVIAVDKTGTITRNEMVIREVFAAGETFVIGGTGYEPKGEIKLNRNVIDAANHPELLLAGKIAAFCANGKAIFSEEAGIWRVAGDPTEAAMFVFAEKIGFHKDDLERESPQIGEIPFDYKTKCHITAHRLNNKQFITVTGAPEAVIHLSVNKYSADKIHPFSEGEKQKIEAVFHGMSKRGLRVVAFAYSETPPPKDSKVLEFIEAKELTFVGLYGMEDSLRQEVPEAMELARLAGIRVVMITGDHRLTAIAIAKEAGIWKEGSKALTDEDIEKLNEEELSKELAETAVFARITPEHKMKIIQGYRRRGEVVAMTGDGVNDAPSLVAADLGVAMGKIGTEVAKEAADIVLLDDNFGNIVSAVREGRNIYQTLQKVLLFLFSTSIGEVFVIIGALFLGWPLPLLAPQILWLNLVTDFFVAFGLAMDVKDKLPLVGRFQKPDRYFVDKFMLWRMIVMALPIVLGTLYLFNFAYEEGIQKAWTFSLTALAIFQWLNGWNCRSDRESVFKENPFASKSLVGFVLAAASLQFFAVYNPFMQKILHITPLSLMEWALIFAVSFSIIIAEEARKFFYRRKVAASG